MRVSRSVKSGSDVSATASDMLHKITKMLDKLGRWFADDTVADNFSSGNSGQAFKFELKFDERVFSPEALESHGSTAELILKVTGATDEYRTYDIDLKWKDTDVSQQTKHGAVVEWRKLNLPENASAADKSKAILEYIQDKYLTSMIVKLTDDATDSYEEITPIKSSSSILMTFNKTADNDETSLGLVAISSSYSIDDTQDAVYALAESDEFVASLPEAEDCTVCVTLDEDGYDVCPAQKSVDLRTVLFTLLKYFYDLQMTCEVINYNSVGIDADALVNECESILWMLPGMISQIQRISVQLTGYAVHPASVISALYGNWADRQFNYTDGVTTLVQKLSSLIDCVELHWCNFEKEHQLTFIGFLNELKQKRDYYIARKLVSC